MKEGETENIVRKRKCFFSHLPKKEMFLSGFVISRSMWGALVWQSEIPKVFYIRL